MEEVCATSRSCPKEDVVNPLHLFLHQATPKVDIVMRHFQLAAIGYTHYSTETTVVFVTQFSPASINKKI